MSLENTLTHQLERLISKADLNVTSEQISLLVRYVLLLDKWNKAYNLTSVRDPKEMLVKHIMDSLVISPYLKGESFIDVGTGPGLPGVPLAILNSDKRFTLVDSLGKRIRFLKQVQYDLGLENILPVQSRIEEYTEYTFDGIISRAFASLNDMLHWCDHLPNINGAFYALKGDIEQNEIDSIPPQYKLINNITLNVPELNAERRLIIITK